MAVSRRTIQDWPGRRTMREQLRRYDPVQRRMIQNVGGRPYKAKVGGSRPSAPTREGSHRHFAGVLRQPRGAHRPVGRGAVFPSSEPDNHVIRFARGVDGELTETGRHATSGAGDGRRAPDVSGLDRAVGGSSGRGCGHHSDEWCHQGMGSRADLHTIDPCEERLWRRLCSRCSLVHA
jgi:hypothetical protein